MTVDGLDALLLCGGLGTRLRPLLPEGQKTMADVGGCPFLDIVVAWLRDQGLRRMVFCCGHRADEVQAYFSRGLAGVEFSFSIEDRPLGTAGALKHAVGALKSSTVVVVNGDSLCDAPLAPLLESHRRRQAVVSIAAVPSADRRDGGFLKLDASGRVVSFDEKVYSEGAVLNAGIYLIERPAIDEIPSGRPVSLEKETLPSLLGRGVFAHQVSSPLVDIGTPDRLLQFREVHA